MITSYNTKLISFGDFFETYHYTKPQLKGHKKPKTLKMRTLPHSHKFAGSINRTRNTVRRLISANFDNTASFLTLTFAENFQDVDQANVLFKAFVRQLRWYVRYRTNFKESDFKYLAVIEFQKRGAIHYHLLMKAPFFPDDFMKSSWPHGYFMLNKIHHVSDVGAYVSKYLQKDVHDPRLRGKRAYQTSRNLVRPFEITDKDFVRGFLSNVGRSAKLIKKNTFDNEYTGKVHYRLHRKGGLGR